jgi:acyl-CoA thioesterase FadM
MSRRETVDEILRIQALRAQEYHSLARAMSARDTEGIQRITDAFRQLSEMVRHRIEASDEDVASVLCRMQQYEAEKLRLTVEIHSLKSSGIQDDEEAGIGGETTCGCADRAGPSPHDVREALKEGIAAMEACVQTILECMDELREMKDE